MRSLLLLALVVGLPSLAARADEAKSPQPAPDKSRPERVHLGATSVTVVDEHEAVDDVISRIRSAKVDPAADKAKKTGSGEHGSGATTTTDTRQENAHSALRSQREQATARANADLRKDEHRERTASARTRTEQKRSR